MKKLLILLLTIGAAGIAMAQQLPMRLWYDREAEFFEEALPIGNGQLGAMVYGGADADSLQLNDMTLWTGKPWDRTLNADAHRWIGPIRETLFDEDYRKADSLQRKMQGPDSEWYEPLGTLVMKDLNGKAGKAEHYRRELDIDRALVRVSYDRDGVHYEREYFASYPHRLIVVHLKASQPKALACLVNLHSLLPHQVERRGNDMLLMRGHAVGDAADAIHFCTLVKVDCGQQGLWGVDDKGNLLITQATEATLYITDETSFNGFDRHPVREGRNITALIEKDIKRLSSLKYNKVKAAHIKDYQQFYNRLTLSLDGSTPNETTPTDLMLKQYTDRNEPNRYLETLYMQFGRYLLISCSRTPGVPANLQGIWNPHLKAPWRSNYTMNINLEENYWPAEVANLTEMTMPLTTFIENLSKNGAYAARNYYGIDRGWCASHNSDIWAMANPVQGMPLWANWNMSGAWLCMSLWEHYLFTQDKDYLRNTAWPLMKGAADFCLDWLMENPKAPSKEGGRELITAPSTSPENMYVTDEGYQGSTCYGGTADLAIIRELLSNASEAATACGDDATPYQKALARLHPYTVGHEGDLNEWYYDWRDQDPKHRHQSHLIGLYPGHHLLSAEHHSSLLSAAEKTLIQKGDQTTGWSTGWRINLWARLHNSRQAYHIYRKLLTYVSPDNYRGPDRRSSGGTYPNLFDAHAPFQIDGNFGGTAGVCEMLIQSSAHEDEASIEFLPALPTEWSAGTVTGLKARGGYTVDMTWQDGKVTNATIKAAKAGTVHIIYNNKKESYKLKARQSLKIQ